MASDHMPNILLRGVSSLLPALLNTGSSLHRGARAKL